MVPAKGLISTMAAMNTDTIKAQGAGTNIGLKGNFGPANGIEVILANTFANVNATVTNSAPPSILQDALNGVTVDGRFGKRTITCNHHQNTLSGRVLAMTYLIRRDEQLRHGG